MKTSKKVLALVLTLCTLTALLTMSAAASPSISARSWDQLISTSNTFDVGEDGKAIMVASTTGRETSTKVSVSMYLERLQNGQWKEVPNMSWSTSSTSNFDVNLSKTRWVTGGYYYRLRSEHYATGPNGTETDTITSAVYYYGG